MINKEEIYDRIQNFDSNKAPWRQTYMLPFSTGERVAYYTAQGDMYIGIERQYQIIVPRKFRICLFYDYGLILLKRDVGVVKPNWFDPWIEIKSPIKLENYFIIETYKGTQIPVAFNKEGLYKQVNRLFNLTAFL